MANEVTIDPSTAGKSAAPVVIPADHSRTPARRRPTSHRTPGRRGYSVTVRGNAAILAVAAGAAFTATAAGSITGAAGATQRAEVQLLATDGTADSPRADGTQTADSADSAVPTPSMPVPSERSATYTATDTGEEVDAAAAALIAATEANTKREIAEEEARRPNVALPAVGSFTSGFGPRWGSFHAGIDIANAVGTPIMAATDGTVVDAGPAAGYGNWVRIMSDDGILTVYGHMSAVNVTPGQRVVAGQQIALMGNEGFSTGSHLHFEVHTDGGANVVDPQVWLADNGINL